MLSHLIAHLLRIAIDLGWVLVRFLNLRPSESTLVDAVHAVLSEQSQILLGRQFSLYVACVGTLHKRIYPETFTGACNIVIIRDAALYQLRLMFRQRVLLGFEVA